MPIFKIKLLERKKLANNTIELRFEKPTNFNFIPGQYGGFTLINPSETDANGITRRFSFLSIPEDNYLAIATRIQNSAYKKVLNMLAIGDEIKLAGPTGNFIMHPEISIPAVFIAGGIGITPFYSMLKQATLQQSAQPIYLFYGNQAPEDSILLDELIELQSKNSQFKLIPTMANQSSTWSGETGFITHTMIKKYIPDIDAPIYYICGSPAMVTALQEMLAEMGINEEKIKVEDFPGY